LPRGVTVAQVTLDHFVMVRIHARQVVGSEPLRNIGFSDNTLVWALLGHFSILCL
jgi:hypothetical protein